MAYIYKITNSINDKVYIGKTYQDIQIRFKQHIYDSCRRKYEQRPLYSAMRKYGTDKFKIELIEETNKPEEREQYWIQYYNSYHYGYNATYGGDGKPVYDRQAIYESYLKIKSIKKVAAQYHCALETVANILDEFGITKEQRIKNSNINRSYKVAMIDKNTKQILHIFNGTHEAGKFIGKSHQHIQDVCAGKRKSAFGYIWKYI